MELGAASRFSLAAKRSGSSWVESLKIKRPRFAAELNHPPLNLTTTQRIMENGELGVQLGMTGLEFNRRSQVFSLAAEWKSTCLHVPLGNQLLELSVLASIHRINQAMEQLTGC